MQAHRVTAAAALPPRVQQELSTSDADDYERRGLVVESVELDDDFHSSVLSSEPQLPPSSSSSWQPMWQPPCLCKRWVDDCPVCRIWRAYSVAEDVARREPAVSSPEHASDSSEPYLSDEDFDIRDERYRGPHDDPRDLSDYVPSDVSESDSWSTPEHSDSELGSVDLQQSTPASDMPVFALRGEGPGHCVDCGASTGMTSQARCDDCRLDWLYRVRGWHRRHRLGAGATDEPEAEEEPCPPSSTPMWTPACRAPSLE